MLIVYVLVLFLAFINQKTSFFSQIYTTISIIQILEVTKNCKTNHFATPYYFTTNGSPKIKRSLCCATNGSHKTRGPFVVQQMALTKLEGFLLCNK
jgi:hypothetical protein